MNYKGSWFNKRVSFPNFKMKFIKKKKKKKFEIKI